MSKERDVSVLTLHLPEQGRTDGNSSISVSVVPDEGRCSVSLEGRVHDADGPEGDYGNYGELTVMQVRTLHAFLGACLVAMGDGK